MELDTGGISNITFDPAGMRRRRKAGLLGRELRFGAPGAIEARKGQTAVGAGSIDGRTHHIPVNKMRQR